MYNYDKRRNNLYSRPETFNIDNLINTPESTSINGDAITTEQRKSSLSELLSAVNSTEFSRKNDQLYANSVETQDIERKSSLSEKYFPLINESYFTNQADNLHHNIYQPMDINSSLTNMNLNQRANYNFGGNRYNNSISKTYNNFDQGMNNGNNGSPQFISNNSPQFISNNSPQFISNNSPQFISNNSPQFINNMATSFMSKPSYEKPPFSYAQLISQAILSATDYLIPLSGIYTFISNNYPYYQSNAKGWQNSIRHNLSLNKYFIRISRYSLDPGKGSLWTIDKDYFQKVYMDAYMPKQTRLKPKKSIDSSSDKNTQNDIYSASNEFKLESMKEILPGGAFDDLKNHMLDRRNSSSSFTIENILSRNRISSADKQTLFTRTLSNSGYNKSHGSKLNNPTNSYNNLQDSIFKKTLSISSLERQRKD